MKRKVTHDTDQGGGRMVRASEQGPQHVDEGDTTGRQAVHKPSALREDIGSYLGGLGVPEGHCWDEHPEPAPLPRRRVGSPGVNVVGWRAHPPNS